MNFYEEVQKQLRETEIHYEVLAKDCDVTIPWLYGVRNGTGNPVWEKLWKLHLRLKNKSTRTQIPDRAE